MTDTLNGCGIYSGRSKLCIRFAEDGRLEVTVIDGDSGANTRTAKITLSHERSVAASLVLATAGGKRGATERAMRKAFASVGGSLEISTK